MRLRPAFVATVAVAMLLAACDSDSTVTSQSTPATLTSVTTTTAVDTAVFDGVTPVDGAEQDGHIVLVGCAGEDLGSFPIWWAEEGFDFQPATGPDVERPQDASCIEEVVSTPFGWFAGGLGPLLRSIDGVAWEVVDIPEELGYEFSGQLGYADNLFISPAGDRLTVLFRRAAEAESTIATLVTTTDGETWVENAHPSQSLFDSSAIAAVIAGGDGLLAAGSSPGGEFVPAAAVFTSPEGLRWRRVTPRGSADFDDKVIEDVMRVGDGYIAVGGDLFQTGLMTAWASPDGIEWRRLPHPPESTDPSVAHMTGQALTVADGFIWVSGRDFDARRAEPQTLPALWRSMDGEAWERVSLDDLPIDLPFEIASTADLRIGVWPPPGSPIDEPITLYAAD